MTAWTLLCSDVIPLQSPRKSSSFTPKTLVRIDNNAVSCKTFENSSEVFEVFFWSGTGDQDIIDKCHSCFACIHRVDT